VDKRRFSSRVATLTGAWKILSKTATTLLPVLALLLTVLSAAATHKHNRLSVLPKLSFVWNTSSDDVVGLFVENAGAGPAVVKNFTIDNRNLLVPGRVFTAQPDVQDFFKTYFLQNGRQVGLITIGRDKVKDRDALDELIGGQVLVTIEYCSIYGDCWTECSNIKDPTCGSKKSPAYDIFNSGFWSRIL
jgi:hypothetical protein